MIHRPEMLILDEPTSGVDPIARDAFWRILIDLSRRDKVTIFISTHFMNEAERCDRISLMHAGRVLVSDTPAALEEAPGADAGRGLYRLPGRRRAGVGPRQRGPEPQRPAPPSPPSTTTSRPAELTGSSTSAVCSATAGARRWNCAAIRSARPWPCSAASS